MIRQPPPAAGRLPEAARARRHLHELIREGVARFDAGDYWHAHESWEDAWKLDRAPDRDFLKGLIQLAAALYHWRRGHLAPAARLLAQARAHALAHLGPRWPFEPAVLMREFDRVAEALSAGEAMPRLHLARLLRG